MKPVDKEMSAHGINIFVKNKIKRIKYLKYSVNHRLLLMILIFLKIGYCESINNDIKESKESMMILGIKEYIDNFTQRYLNFYFINKGQLDFSEFFENFIRNIVIFNEKSTNTTSRSWNLLQRC